MATMNDIAQYDTERAAEQLQRQAEVRLQTSHIVKCASQVLEDEEWVLTYQSIRYGAVWRLVMSPEEGLVEEVVLAFQGVVYQKDLAPFNPKTFHERPNTARFLGQSLTLCGLHAPLFQKAANTVLEIHALLARSVAQDEMENCSMVSVDEKGDTLLHMGNRYLTPKKDAVGQTTMPIPLDVDPQGHLTRLAGNSFVYTNDNHVRFYECRRVPGTEELRYEGCKPVIFRVGDLVEAQVTFIIVNLREGKKKTSMVLRSLSLLDGSFTQRSMVALLHHRDETNKVEQPLKRRVGYAEEETASKVLSENEEDGPTRPTVHCRVGYSQEGITEATRRMSTMGIEGGSSKDVDVD